MPETIGTLLEAIDLSSKDLAPYETLEDEFKHIKKTYFKKALVTHPDKGGDPDEFRRVNSAFEVLRKLFETGGVKRFRDSTRRSAQAEYKYSYEEHAGVQPSWDYYYSMAEEPVPVYRVEIAKTGRSQCNAKGKRKLCDDPHIAQGDVRCGFYQKETGTYGRWSHLDCWHVPAKIWLGLPDPEKADRAEFEGALAAMNEVQFCGYEELPPEARRRFTDHCMQKENWSRLVHVRPKAEKKDLLKQIGQYEGEEGEEEGEEGAEEEKPKPKSGPGALGTVEERARKEAMAVGRKQRFVIPKPGVGKNRPPDFLNGKSVVLTGTFPEVGGSSGLREGKDKVKEMVESFGGQVKSAVSGKTDLLIVGKEPGYSKVAKARASEGDMAIISLHDLKQVLESKEELEDAAQRPLQVESFSEGFRGSGLSRAATPEMLQKAAGRKAPKEELIADTKKGGTYATTGRLSLPDPDKPARAKAAAKPPSKRGGRGGKAIKRKAEEEEETEDTPTEPSPSKRTRSKKQQHV